MKKKTLGLLVAAMCLTLSACGAAESNCTCGADCPCRTAETDDVSLESTDDANADSLLLESICYETPVICINEDMFGSLIKERIELTTENWKDYLEIATWEEEDIVYDGFGEVKETATYQRWGMIAPSEEGYYHVFETALIELKEKETGILYTYDLSYGGDSLEDDDYNDKPLEGLDFDDYECTRIKGAIYFVDLPEEAIAPYTDTQGGYSYTACFIGNANSCEDTVVNEYTKRFFAWGVEEWQEKYMNN